MDIKDNLIKQECVSTIKVKIENDDELKINVIEILPSTLNLEPLDGTLVKVEPIVKEVLVETQVKEETKFDEQVKEEIYMDDAREGVSGMKTEELMIKNESDDSDSRREHNHFRDLNENGMVKEQKCDYCPFISKNKDDLKVHMLEYCEEIGKMHACPLCSYKTIYKFQLKNHVLARHDKKSIKKHKCEYCNFKSSYKCSLLKHVSSVHSATSTETYVCGYCDYTNNNSYLLKKHIWKMHKEETVNTYSCDYCNFVTRKATILRRHKLCQHQRQTSKRYACDQCEYNTQYRGILIKHGLKVHKLAPTDDQSNLGKISITLL